MFHDVNIQSRPSTNLYEVPPKRDLFYFVAASVGYAVDASEVKTVAITITPDPMPAAVSYALGSSVVTAAGQVNLGDRSRDASASYSLASSTLTVVVVSVGDRFRAASASYSLASSTLAVVVVSVGTFTNDATTSYGLASSTLA